MATSDDLDQVQKLYIAYFGRPADPGGLNYWASQVNAAGGNMVVAIAGFAASTESTNLFGGLPSAQKISAIYLNLFNRLPEGGGLSYWMNQLDSGAITQAQAAWDIMNQAGPGDATSVANKLAMANTFTARIVTTAEINGYNGAQPAAYGRAYLAGVDATQASVSNATAALNTSVADATGVKPVAPVVTTPAAPTGDTVFNFTTLADNFVGGVGNDTFKGVLDTTVFANSTITSLDTINGGAGTDTLSITVTGLANASMPGLSISNVEKLVVRDLHTTNTLSNYNLLATGITDVTSDVSTTTGIVQFANVADGATVTLLGNNVDQVSSVQFFMANPASTANLVLDGGLKDTGVAGLTTVSNMSGSATAVSITSSGAANTLGTLTLAGSAADTITTLSIKAATDLTAALVATDYASSATLTVSGTGKVDLGRTLGFDGNIIDASANSGGLTIAVGGNIKSYTGSTGNDILVGTAPVADSAIIDGGLGVDTFSATMINATNGLAFKNFEVIDLGASSVSVDISKLSNSTITGAVLGSTTATTAVLDHLKVTPGGFNLTSTGGKSGAQTELKFDDATGTSDVLNLTHDSSITAAAMGKLTTEGIEIIKIASGGSVVNTFNGVNIVDNAAQLIEITGNQIYSLNVTAQSNITLGGASQLTKVDGSQATGQLTIRVEEATATGGQTALTLIGGSAADRFIVSTSAIANSGGVTVTTGAGNDTVNLTNATLRDPSRCFGAVEDAVHYYQRLLVG